MELDVSAPSAGSAWHTRVQRAGAMRAQQAWDRAAHQNATAVKNGVAPTINDPLVAPLADYLNRAFPGALRMLGRKLLNPTRSRPGQVGWEVAAEFDISLSFAVIEVKTGNFQDLYQQLPRIKSHTGLPVVAYAPGISRSLINGLRSRGHVVFGDARELAGYLQPLSRGRRLDLDAIAVPSELPSFTLPLSSKQRRLAVHAKLAARMA